MSSWQAISGIRIPRIGLDADVPSRFLEGGGEGGGSWEIPGFKVGHAQFTGEAGKPGNAVLLGHVTSINAGAVFRDLDGVRVGDDVTIVSSEHVYRYVVSEARRVPRTDVTVLAPTRVPFATLITRTGARLPQLNDYAERLVVRAALEGLVS